MFKTTCCFTVLPNIGVNSTTLPTCMERYSSISNASRSVKCFLQTKQYICNTPYLFNTKEFDEETRMHYYADTMPEVEFVDQY